MRRMRRVNGGVDGRASRGRRARLRPGAYVLHIFPLPQNVGQRPLAGAALVFTFDGRFYSMPRPLSSLPLLLPGIACRVDADVDCVDAGGGADVVNVVVVGRGSDDGDASITEPPLLYTTVCMPAALPAAA